MVVEKYKFVSPEDNNRLISNIQLSDNNHPMNINLYVDRSLKNVQNIYLQQAILIETEKQEKMSNTVLIVNHAPAATISSTVNIWCVLILQNFQRPVYECYSFF